jgi:hypothetical protein
MQEASSSAMTENAFTCTMVFSEGRRTRMIVRIYTGQDRGEVSSGLMLGDDHLGANSGDADIVTSAPSGLGVGRR